MHAFCLEWQVGVLENLPDGTGPPNIPAVASHCPESEDVPMSPEPDGSSGLGRCSLSWFETLVEDDIIRPLEAHLVRGRPCEIKGVRGSAKTAGFLHPGVTPARRNPSDKPGAKGRRCPRHSRRAEGA